MKFADLIWRVERRELSQVQAAEVLGMSERTFRRWRDRYEAEGAEGLYDRRLGLVSARRVPVDTVMEVLELFDTKYWDFTARHFWEKLVESHGFTRQDCQGFRVWACIMGKKENTHGTTQRTDYSRQRT
jgi:hypothetical protein